MARPKEFEPPTISEINFYSDKSKLFWIYTNAILNKTLDDIKSINNEVIVVDPTVRLYGEKKEKPIYGEATIEQARELAEEEINVVPLPWAPTKKTN